MTPTSTIITTWAPQAINYIWDSITGFFYQANADTFIVVFIIVIGLVCLIIASIKSVVPVDLTGRHKL